MNIHGATSKIEQSNIIELFNKYDVVCLSELKHTYPLTIPGFQYIRSRVITGEEHRGGVGILIKQNLWPEVHDIDINHDQVWFSLQSVPDTVFGAIYISPRDSPYYRPQSFATIQEHCNCENVFILGDFNARLSSLNIFKNPTRNIDYTPNPDGIINANGRELLSLCDSNGLIPVNHLQINQTSCEGGLTYKKKQRWISQLDWAICTESAAKYVQSFNILHCEELPTDHAALSLQISGFERSPSHLLNSAKQLDSYIVNKPNENRLIQRPIPFNSVNRTVLIDNLPPKIIYGTLLWTVNLIQCATALWMLSIKLHNKPQPLPVRQPPDIRRKRMIDGITFFTTRMINRYGKPLTGRAVSTLQTPKGKNRAMLNSAPILKLSLTLQIRQTPENTFHSTKDTFLSLMTQLMYQKFSVAPRN